MSFPPTAVEVREVEQCAQIPTRFVWRRFSANGVYLWAVGLVLAHRDQAVDWLRGVDVIVYVSPDVLLP